VSNKKPGLTPQTQRAHALYVRASHLEDLGESKRAINTYLQAAKLGHVYAQSNLATLLDDVVSPPRGKEAVYWYKKSVKGGNDTAAWNLAMHYRNLGKSRWYQFWLNVAARMGDEDARVELAKEKRSTLRNRNGSLSKKYKSFRS
jgi:TPR repeat protein